MHSKYFIPAFMGLGLVVLLFFPEPESNFLIYVVTFVFFILTTILLINWQKRQK